MNCKDVEQYLVDRALKIAPEESCVDLDRHLETCSHCRRIAEEYRLASLALRPERSAPNDAEMADRIVELASRKKQDVVTIHRIMVSAAAVAALFLVVVVTPFIISSRPGAMTNAGVLDAYIEDWNAMAGVDGSETAASAFSYEAYGVPAALAEYFTDESN